MVLCEQVGEAEARALAERVTAAVAAPCTVGPHEVRVTASVGVTMRSAPVDPETLLREADAAMYRAKSNGKGRSEFSGR